MKKLLTILLIIFLSGQVSGLFHVTTHEINFIQDADEKHEKGSKEKNEKEYISHTSLINADLSLKKSFGSYSIEILLSPVMDHLTPPPDDKL